MGGRYPYWYPLRHPIFTQTLRLSIHSGYPFVWGPLKRIRPSGSIVRLFKCAIAGVYAKFFALGTSGGMTDCQSRLSPFAVCAASSWRHSPFACECSTNAGTANTNTITPTAMAAFSSQVFQGAGLGAVSAIR